MQPAVIKIGGALLNAPAQMDAFWNELEELTKEHPVVLVHGGGSQATELAERLGHTPKIVQGRRVTSDLDLKTVHWSMCGAINTELVAQASKRGLKAVGLTGADGNMLQVSKRPPWQIDGEEVDFGWVGDVVDVDTTLFETLLPNGITPILSPLGIDENGQTYNVNADTVACSIAKALGAKKLLLVTGAGGVRREARKSQSKLDECTPETFESGVENGWIEGGMRVKLRTAFDSLQGGVDEVFILSPDDLASHSHATQVLHR